MAPCAGHWGVLPTAWKEVGFPAGGGPHTPIEEKQASREAKVMGKAASSAVNSDPRPRGHAPSAPHTLPRQVCSSPRALPMFSQHHSSHLSQDQGLASCTGRSFLQPGDAGAGSSSSLKHMPPAPTRSLELPLQHTPGTEFTLFAGSTPRPPPSPASGRCLPRGTCRCGAELCLFPGPGQVPGQQACPAASAQHLFTGGGARDKLILFVVTSICPHPCPPVFCPAGHPELSLHSLC